MASPWEHSSREKCHTPARPKWGGEGVKEDGSRNSSSIEKKTKEAVLQQGIKVKIGGKSYEVAPPTIATLILVSEAVARIPKISLDKERITQEVLSWARMDG